MANLFRKLFRPSSIDQDLKQSELARELARVKAEIARDTPDNPALRGYKIYSQTDEDGIIAAIFERIGGGGTFIEIGCGDGLENNTHALALQGWRGVWVDARKDKIAFIRSQVGESKALRIDEGFVTRENAPGLVRDWTRWLGTMEVDFFSVDIDGNDLHVLLSALTAFRPRVICVEYNAKFPPPLEVAVAYDPDLASRDDYHSASLMAFVTSLASLGYDLVCCNLSGANAFFVARPFADRFTRYEPSRLYQPARFHLAGLKNGHPHSLRFLRDRLSGKLPEGGGEHQ